MLKRESIEFLQFPIARRAETLQFLLLGQLSTLPPSKRAVRVDAVLCLWFRCFFSSRRFFFSVGLLLTIAFSAHVFFTSNNSPRILSCWLYSPVPLPFENAVSRFFSRAELLYLGLPTSRPPASPYGQRDGPAKSWTDTRQSARVTFVRLSGSLPPRSSAPLTPYWSPRVRGSTAS